MKKYTAIILGALLLGAVSLRAQTSTNSPGTNTVQGGVQEIITAMESGETNWWGEAHGLYASGLPKHWGGGAGLFWNVSQYVYTGIRVDYVNGFFWMPSGSATLQVPIQIFSWLRIAPFGYAGVGIPLSGASVGGTTLGNPPKDNNDQPTAILGYGAAVRLYTASSNPSNWYIPNAVDILYDRETWTGFNGQQQRLAVAGQWFF
jgi:hypothetical protein